MQKTCTRCHCSFPLSEEYWNRNPVSGDGFHYSCKACRHVKAIYSRWRDMIQRCYNPRCVNYKHYGARGITVCDEWRRDSRSFEQWSLRNGFSPELSIDRIDNDADYTPENCRWTRKSVQNMSRRSKNTSGFIGVSQHSTRTGWYGRLKVDCKQLYTGFARSALEAAIMRDRFIIDNGLPNKLNGVLK